MALEGEDCSNHRRPNSSTSENPQALGERSTASRRSHDRDELEATELEVHPTCSSEHGSGRITSDGALQTPALRRLPTSDRHRNEKLSHLKKFWRHQVAVSVPHDLCRDHLALERTYLGYHRTSLALAMIAVIVAQLYPLQASGEKVERKLKFQHIAKPMAVVLVASSMMVTILGVIRFWRQQNAMVRGKIWTASWETVSTGVLAGLLMIVLLILTLVAQPEIHRANSEF